MSADPLTGIEQFEAGPGKIADDLRAPRAEAAEGTRFDEILQTPNGERLDAAPTTFFPGPSSDSRMNRAKPVGTTPAGSSSRSRSTPKKVERRSRRVTGR